VIFDIHPRLTEADRHEVHKECTRDSSLTGSVRKVALGTAIGDLPMLLSPRTRNSGHAFLAGWVMGLAIAGVVVLALSNSIGLEAVGGGGSIPGPELKIVLGLILPRPAFRQWRKRPGAGEQPFCQDARKCVEEAFSEVH
jgi:hypothetical protein